jgi:hypothetical protein
LSLRIVLISLAAALCVCCASALGSDSPKAHPQDSSCQNVPVPYFGSVDLDRTPDPEAPDGLLIPSSLREALRELDHMLPDDVKASMRCGSEKDMNHYHFALGLWVRNNWGLWAGGALADYFRELGIKQPDDMSGIIFTSYWRQLQGRPIELEAQARYYDNYWSARADPGPFMCPNSGIETAPTTWFHDEIPPDQWVVYHVVSCGDGIYWVYEKSHGWKPASQEILDLIQ